jgi:GntR family transcriptional regulator, gluconate operon transcriptional repressor
MVMGVETGMGNPMATLRPLHGQTLGAQAADAIRELIVSGQLAAGDRIVEARVAERLGISRGPVRDALRLLSQEGLVRDEPRRGTFVVQLTAHDVRDIYELRIALETTAVRLIIQQDRPEPLAQIRGVIEDMRAVARNAPLAARQDLRFHGTVCAVSGNSRLYDVFVRHATELLILLRLDEEELSHAPDSIVGEHEELLEALGKSVTEAEAAFRAHLEDARDRLAAHIGAPGGGPNGRPRERPSGGPSGTRAAVTAHP